MARQNKVSIKQGPMPIRCGYFSQEVALETFQPMIFTWSFSFKSSVQFSETVSNKNCDEVLII